MSNKKKRYLLYFISRLISRIAPFISIIIIYGLFEDDEPAKQVTGISMISIVILVSLFFNDLKTKTKSMYDTRFKYAMVESKILVVTFIIFLFIQWAKSGIMEIETLVIIIMITQALAIFPSAWHRKLVEEQLNEKENETVEENEEKEKRD